MMLVQHIGAIPEPPDQPLLSIEQNRHATSIPTPTSNSASARKRPQFAIRDAVLSDAQQIALLGAATFTDTFGFSIPPKDLQAYLQEAYSLAAISADIVDPTKHVVVACSPAGSLLGFAQLTEGTTEPCLEGVEKLVELQRLYVNRECHGGGVGRALTAKTEEMARSFGYETMWLGVWEGNFVAQKVYEAMGFERAGDHEFRMGKCIQIDWIMCKSL